MDQATRNKLRNAVTRCRRLLEDAVAEELQGRYGIYAAPKKDEVVVEDGARMGHLRDEEQAFRRDLLDHYEHIRATGAKPKESLDQLKREIAFTHLNRICAYKMMEAREVYIGGQRFRDAVSRGVNSNGVMFYLADHPEDERLYTTGNQELAYRHFLDWLGGRLSEEIGILFSPDDPANRLYPPQRVLDQVLDLINDEALGGIWSQDETVGWVYQYFTPKELRDQARKESQAPRNSYELAFRNQFFTPRYVVEFLTDNTLGRIWYEMRQGDTALRDRCRYLVRRPNEVFLDDPDAFSLGQCRPWVRKVRSGDFSELPDDPREDELATISFAFNGYTFAEQTGRYEVDLLEWANARLEAFERSGERPASSLDLWMMLFALQRGHRIITGSGPAGDQFLGLWRNVYLAWREALRTEQSGERSQEEMLQQPVYIPHRPRKDPREIRLLDPAVGSAHFLLYAFDLLLTIYEEAYTDPVLGPALQQDYPTLDDLRKAVPGLILKHNLHGIDIDLRATQISALALWLRCQRAYQEMGLKKDRPRITRSNIVCAEPMPGERALLDEFLRTLRDDRLEALIGRVMTAPEGRRVRATEAMADSLCNLVRLVWEKMQLAGEAGSLLKIEEELKVAIGKGQREWEEKQPLFRVTEYGLTEQARESYVRIVPGDEVTFWDRAEVLVRAALEDFAAFASDGKAFQRKLFVGDAMRGLAFVDLCRERFDVALMNPPFGASSKPSKAYMERAYPGTKNDVYAAFVECGLHRMRLGGLLGAITSRSGFFLTSFQKWREEILLGKARPTVVADLGYGVLDTAMVETAAYVEERRAESAAPVPTYFLRLLERDDKPAVLSDIVRLLRDGLPCSAAYAVAPESFRQVPGAPFAYWVSGRVRNIFVDLQPFECKTRTAKQGLATADDFRFVRLSWEVSLTRVIDCSNSPNWREQTNDFKDWCLGQTFKGKRWVPFAKGGAFSRFYSDIHLLVDWLEGGREMYRFNGIPFGGSGAPMRNPDYYFRPGLTWSLRTQLGLTFRAMPAGCIFGHKGPAAFLESELLEALPSVTSIMNSSIYQSIVDLQTAFGSYEVGVIQRTPIPNIDQHPIDKLDSLARSAVDLKRSLDSSNEISHAFGLPALLQVRGETLADRVVAWQSRVAEVEQQLTEIQRHIDDTAFSLYDIDGEDRLVIEARGASRPTGECGVDELAGAEDEIDAEIDPRAANGVRYLLVSLLSYSIGCALGRWDLYLAIGEQTAPEMPDPFAPLPVCSPGMLQGSDGLPLDAPPEDYPVRIDRDGILVDDPSHADDVVRRVRDVLEVVWKDRADSIEREACEILGVKEMRDYVRRPGKGGFWDDHVSRYSKSRRKAPIYWLLQSSKKNYALWLYYHRLDKDILFKALSNYVEPKIRLEKAQLDTLRAQQQASGEPGKGSKKLDKEIDRQEEFVSELRDFADKLARAARLDFGPSEALDSSVTYDPDLNDGVVLNIAPLHELVPWKEARTYWDALMKGEYEWSSIAQRLRAKGLVP